MYTNSTSVTWPGVRGEKGGVRKRQVANTRLEPGDVTPHCGVKNTLALGPQRPAGPKGRLPGWSPSAQAPLPAPIRAMEKGEAHLHNQSRKAGGRLKSEKRG